MSVSISVSGHVRVFNRIVEHNGSHIQVLDGMTGKICYVDADVTTAIQYALDAGESTLIRKAETPYDIQRTLRPQSNCSIVLESGVVLRQADKANLWSMIAIRNATNVEIVGGEFDGNYVNQTGPTHPALIRIEGSCNISVRDFYMHDVFAKGIEIREDQETLVPSNRVFVSRGIIERAQQNFIYVRNSKNVIIEDVVGLLTLGGGPYGYKGDGYLVQGRAEVTENIELLRVLSKEAACNGIDINGGSNILVSGCQVCESGQVSEGTGILICAIEDFGGTKNVTIDRNISFDNSQAKGQNSGIRIDVRIGMDQHQNVVITNNFVYDSRPQVNKTQKYGLDVGNSSADYVAVINNTFSGNRVANVHLGGGVTYDIKNNIGCVVENWGNATIHRGELSVSVAHGLDTGKPTEIHVTPKDDLGELTFFYTANCTHLIIRLSSKDDSSDHDFAWYAKGI